jgi:succinyl-diaminopimelate desuccinylase
MPDATVARDRRSLEERVLAQIDRDEVIAFHAAIVRVPSVNPPGDVRDAYTVVERTMREGGFDTRSVGDREDMPNLIAT